jgi:predicted nucleotidyltransferase
MKATASDVHPEVREVADALIAALGQDLRALLWHGSYARGEARPESDHDLIIILRRIEDDVLLRLREVFRGRERWSSLVKTEEELRQYPPTGRLQFHFGVVPLYGHFERPAWTRESLVDDLRQLALDIGFEARYRLLHKQPDNYSERETRIAGFQRYRNLHMLHYAAKWAVLAMKARALLAGGDYPVTLAELRGRLDDADDLAIVDLVDRWTELAAPHEADFTPLALQLDAFARRLIAGLPEGTS